MGIKNLKGNIEHMYNKGQPNNSFNEKKYNYEILETIDEDKKLILLKLKNLGIDVNMENALALLNVFTKEMADHPGI